MLGGLGGHWAWFLGPQACARERGNPTKWHSAGGIRLLSHRTKWVPQSPDWAQVPSRDFFPIPNVPLPPQAVQNLPNPQFRGNFAPSHSPESFFSLSRPASPSPRPLPPKSLASLLTRERLVSGLEVPEGVVVWGLQRGGWGQVLSAAEGGQKISEKPPFAPKRIKRKPPLIIFISALPPPPSAAGRRAVEAAVL